MKILFSFAVAMCLVLSSSAQKVYFVYLQTEDNQPFYAKMSDKIFSSASSGYLVLPNLIDSTYIVSIGFPSGRSESRFTIQLKARDRGFLIRNTDNALVLVDLETASVIKPMSGFSRGTTSYETRTDLFTTLLAKAAGDSSLLYVAVKQDNGTKKEEHAPVIAMKTEEPKTKKEEIEKPAVTNIRQEEAAVKKDSIVNSTVSTNTQSKTLQPDVSSNAAQQKQNVSKQESTNQKSLIDSVTISPPVVEYRRSKVKKYSESSTSEGFGLVYLDTYEGVIDTIRMIIPNPKYQFVSTEPESKLEKKQGSDVANNTIAKNNSKENIEPSLTKKDTVAIAKDTMLQKPLDKSVPKLSNEKPGSTIIKPVKPACPNIASNDEFLKLRKNMAAKSNDEAMVSEAKRFFKTKCFTTMQIKNLSTLFLTPAGKYEFFDVAYMHVSDQEQFSSLQSEIKDDYYFKRFKALVGE